MKAPFIFVEAVMTSSKGCGKQEIGEEEVPAPNARTHEHAPYKTVYTATSVAWC